MLKQTFYVGDGLTSGGVQQGRIVPAGATRLYLGTMDGYEWSNNSGAFTARVDVVPEPSSLLCLAGCVLIGLRLARRVAKRSD